MPIHLFIEDGQVYDGCISNVQGHPLTPPLTFKFRPADYMDLNRHYDAVAKDEALGKLPESEKDAAANLRLIAERLQSWSAAGPLNVDRLRRLNPFVASRLYRIVIGNDASDPLPDGTTPETPENAAKN